MEKEKDEDEECHHNCDVLIISRLIVSKTKCLFCVPSCLSQHMSILSLSNNPSFACTKGETIDSVTKGNILIAPSQNLVG